MIIVPKETTMKLFTNIKNTYNKLTNRPIEVNSKAIEWVSYDRRSKELTVAFKNRSGSDRIYAYSNVDPKLVKAFEVSPSKGKFFSKMIRNDYPTKSLT